MTTAAPDHPPRGMPHHIELWVTDLTICRRSWEFLLGRLGYEPFQDWENGFSLRLGATYIVFERSPALLPGDHERCRPGLNHLAFHAGTPPEVDALALDATEYGWRLMFPDRHPYAGGPDHYAAYLSDPLGHEVELVASITSAGDG